MFFYFNKLNASVQAERVIFSYHMCVVSLKQQLTLSAALKFIRDNVHSG